MKQTKAAYGTLFAMAAAILLMAFPAASASAVQKGILDMRVNDAGTTGRAANLSEIRNQLHAGYTRITLFWSLAEPQEGVYDEAYLADRKDLVDTAYNLYGLRVIVTVYGTPSWAANTAVSPRTTSLAAAPSAAGIQAFGAFATKLRQTLGTSAWAYECWNEPNLGAFLYPQRAKFGSGWNTNYSANLYVMMLHAFHDGIVAGTAAAADGFTPKVIAGATAPAGDVANTWRTTPQQFAARLHALHAETWFDAYSHHPYAVGGTTLAPELAPRFPTTAVSLGNLSVLLKIFPKKPFYLTEYAYHTAATIGWSGQAVSQATQASYLVRAYKYAARYPQVTMIIWFLVKDWKASPTATTGVFTGLRTYSGAPKLSWFAFAGGNSLTIKSLPSVKRGKAILIYGTLGTSLKPTTALSAKTLVVQSKLPGRSWVTVKSFVSRVGGAYTVTVKPTATASWRVTWSPIVTSGSRTITVSR
jgi:hypothetical protein